MSRHQPLFARSHIPNIAFHSSLPSQGTAQLKVWKENRSSTEVEGFKELNLSYTINLYIPGTTNTHSKSMVWGVFPAGGTTEPWQAAPGVPGLALALSWRDLSLLHLPGARQRTSNQRLMSQT